MEPLAQRQAYLQSVRILKTKLLDSEIDALNSSLGQQCSLAHTKTNKINYNFFFFFQVYEDNKLSYFIDGREEGYSSWMRFIQCARSKDEQNLFAFQYKDSVYYRSFKDIDVGDELLVWYDDGYLQHFGIPTGLQDTFFVTSDAGGRFILVCFQRSKPTI